MRLRSEAMKLKDMKELSRAVSLLEESKLELAVKGDRIKVKGEGSLGLWANAIV